MCIYIYIYTHTYIHTYLHTYIHAYIHTYMHTYIQVTHAHTSAGVMRLLARWVLKGGGNSPNFGVQGCGV